MKRLYYVILGLLLWNCQRYLDIELPYEGDRLVILGLLSPDSVITTRIQQTGPPTGRFLFSESIVPNATARLFENGVFVEELKHAGNSIYRSPSGFKPSTGKGYFLKVSAPNLPDAETGSEIIPSAVKVNNYVFQDTISSLFNSNDYPRRLMFEFADDGQKTDFYSAELTGYYKKNEVALNTFYIDRPLEAGEDLCGFRAADNRYVYQDVCFNGKTFSTDLGVSTGGSVQDTIGITERRGEQVTCDQILLRFRKVTKTYRDYLRLSGFENDGFLQAFTTPIREYTNVKGGYGLWAAYSENAIDILK